MSQTIQEVMTPDPVALPADAPLSEAARQMKQRDIGDVIVLDNDKVCGRRHRPRHRGAGAGGGQGSRDDHAGRHLQPFSSP